jgi:hypothetical protein
MSDQPEALRLADELAFAARHYDSFDKRLSSGASNELRRQHSEIVELKAERDALTDVVHRSGFRRCDIAACNCGSWHQAEGWPQRYREIKEATDDDYVNGETLLRRVERICAKRDALLKALKWTLENCTDNWDGIEIPAEHKAAIYAARGKA